MPKKAMDYSKNVIYKIVSNDLDIKDLYVGHTTNFVKRKGRHKSDCNNENSKSYNYKVYHFIRENGGWSNWSMVLVEYYTCDNELEAIARERYWFELLNGTLNTQYPNRNQKEYYNTNKDNIIEKQKQYYNDNKNDIIEKQKQYNDDNKYKIAEYQKEYYENNKKELLEYNKKYKEQNKDKIKE
jgi:hypothetical protein